MEDVNNVVKDTQEDTLDLSTGSEQTREESKEERTVPLQALQEERRKRQEMEQRLATIEASLNKPSSTSDDSDPDLEAAIAKLDPVLRRRGFLTRGELEEEKNANAYAEEMKALTNKYDGKDGRPAFDAYEVAEWGKSQKVYNLEVAYEQMHKKELLDWQMKQGTQSEVPETEKANTSVFNTQGNNSMLTRDALKRKLDAPGGREWWEKNREKVMAAIAKGEFSS